MSAGIQAKWESIEPPQRTSAKGSIDIKEAWQQNQRGTYFNEYRVGPNKVEKWESKHQSGQLGMQELLCDTWIPGRCLSQKEEQI